SRSLFENCTVARGEIVLISINVMPGLTPCHTPPSEKRTCSTSEVSETMAITTSLCSASSRGDLLTAAPSATTGSHLDFVRLNTTRGNPALRRLIAMGCPMIPVPMNPTLNMVALAVNLGVRKLKVKWNARTNHGNFQTRFSCSAPWEVADHRH